MSKDGNGGAERGAGAVGRGGECVVVGAVGPASGRSRGAWVGASGGIAIEAQGLRYTYPGARSETLHGLDFSVRRGEIFGFLGPSGSGKSTTQRLLIGSLRGYGGGLRVFGDEVSGLGADYRERIGVVFEVPNLYAKLSARENLDFFAGLYRGPTLGPMELLERVGLGSHADQRVATFSKGMKMRLNFCRALLHRPTLLFLDEPTSGQDPAHAKLLRGMVQELREGGATVFLTTHNMHEAAELCDRVAFIADGALAASGRPRELMLAGLEGGRQVRVELAADARGEGVREGPEQGPGTRLGQGLGRGPGHGLGQGALVSRSFPLAGLGANRDFLALLEAGVVESIHSQEATLEDVFVAATGRALR